MNYPCVALVILAAGLSACSTAENVPPAPSVTAMNADEKIVLLKNGTRIVGAIEREAGGKLFINAGLLGLIVVDASARAQPGEVIATKPGVELTNGTRLIGKPEKKAGGKVSINAELIGPVVIDISALKSPSRAP